MKLIIFLFIFLIFQLNANESYCIEVISYKTSAKISQEETKNIYQVIDNFQKARLEKNDKFTTLKVYDFNSTDEANSTLNEIKKIFKNAKVKKCLQNKKTLLFETPPKYISTKPIQNEIKKVKYVFENDIDNNSNINSEIDIDKNVINSGYKKNDDIEDIIKETKKYENQTNRYNPNKFLKGLYLNGQYEKNSKKNSSKYSLELNYELFNNGYYEANKKDKKFLADTKIEIYNALEYLKNKSIENKKGYLTIVKNTINYHYYKNLKEAYTLLYKEKEIQLKNNEITILDMKEFESEIKNVNLYIELYEKSQKNRIDQKIYDVINKIENIDLIDKEKIIILAEENDYSIKTQDSYIDKTKLLDDWWIDNLRVNFYVKHEDNYGDEGDFIGARVEIPFGVDSEKKELAKLKENSYKNQKRVLEIRNRQTITLLIENFNFIKQEIKIFKNELSLLIDKYMIAKLKGINFSSINKISKEDEMIDIQILEQKHKIILKRFDLYKTLINLQILANSNDIIQKAGE